jgi:hypothetical protein
MDLNFDDLIPNQTFQPANEQERNAKIAEVFEEPELSFDDLVPQEAQQEKITTPTTNVDVSKSGRFLTGMADPVYGAAQLIPRAVEYLSTWGGLAPENTNSVMAKVTKTLADKIVNEREKEYQASKEAAGVEGIDWMRGLGNVASPVVAGKATSMLPKAASAAGVAAQNFGLGAGSMLLSPVDTTEQSYPEGKTEQMVTGGAVSMALPIVGKGLSQIIKPTLAKGVDVLRKEGVRLTPGQMIGGVAKNVEDAATSIPLFGSAISNARSRGIDDLNRAVANRALKPIGQTLPDGVKTGNEMVAHVRETLGKQYDELLPTLTGKFDKEFIDEVRSLDDLVGSLKPEQAAQFRNIIKNQVMPYISKNGSISGESLKRITSTLSEKSSGYRKDTTYDNRELGNAFESFLTSFRGMVKRSNPDKAAQLSKIDEGYANYMRLKKAAGSVGADEGVFTAGQLKSAVRNADKSKDKGRYSEGKAMMQDLSNAASKVLPSKVPDSGTATRTMVGLAGAGATGLVSPVALGGMAAGAGMYTRPGIALSDLMLARRPEIAKPIAKGVELVSNPADLSRFIFRR